LHTVKKLLWVEIAFRWHCVLFCKLDEQGLKRLTCRCFRGQTA